MNRLVFTLALGVFSYPVPYIAGPSRDFAAAAETQKTAADNNSVIEKNEPYLQFPDEKAPAMIDMLSRALTGEAVVPDVESEVTSGVYIVIDSF